VLQLDVALTPRLLGPARVPLVVVLVDVLRATSTATTLFALGACGVEVAGSLRQARARAGDGRVVCAERWSGRPAPGSGLPISPSRLVGSAVAGRAVVLCTTNGTRALRRVAPRASHVLLGCLLNLSAAATDAVVLASRLGATLSVVCAGRHLGAIPCLDDTYAAGAIIARAEVAAARLGQAVACTDAAKLARLAFDAVASPYAALAASATSQVLRRAHSEADIAFCARMDVTDLVPVLVGRGAEARCPVVLL